MNADTRALLHVVAGIVLNENGDYLLSSRPEGKPYAGYWEFAGGKVEAGESELAALQREFEEELGIRIHAARPWLTKIHEYEHARVYLRFFRVEAADWSGVIQSKEGQKWSWQKAGDFTVSPMLPANDPILKALAVPTVFEGSFSDGYFGRNSQGVYAVLPPHLWDYRGGDMYGLEQPEAVLFQPHNNRAWYHITDLPDWNDDLSQANGILWRVENEANAQAALEKLQNGLPVPLLIDSTAALNHRFAEQWKAAGVHTLVVNG